MSAGSEDEQTDQDVENAPRSETDPRQPLELAFVSDLAGKRGTDVGLHPAQTQ